MALSIAPVVLNPLDGNIDVQDARISAVFQSQKSKADITIVDLLYRYLELETDIEVKRQQLVAECADFNTIDAFRFLDRNGSGEVTF
jgi:myo-inositol-1-phosphate synthase